MSNETQMTAARAGRVTDEIARVARDEFRDAETVRVGVAAGTIAIPCNRNRPHERIFGVGRILRTKINANIGQSTHSSGVSEERDKLELAVRYGSDMVMDLSTGPGSPDVLADVVRRSPVPVGTVPIYQALTRVEDPMDLTTDGLLDVIGEQARMGVDFMTVHAGLLRGHLPFATARKAGIVSRGGAILAKWMQVHGRENPLFTDFDRVLELCLEHDVTLSLGDGLRPGCLADASDEAQFAELKVLGDLVRRCRAAGVQAMVEGPGHVPLDQIEMNMRREREECDDAPFYILGPVVADCAPGYDHITAAIGGALGAMYGAAMLCYVTPREHLGLPDAEDVRTGVVAFKLAAHAADVALKRPHARDRDDAISDARVAFDWEKQFALALDPERARSMHRPAGIGTCAEDGAVCTMCGPKFCSMRISQELKKQSQDT